MKLFWKMFTTVFVSFVVVVIITFYVISLKQISGAERRIVDENTVIGTLISSQVELGYLGSMWPFDSLNRLSDRRDFLFWWVVRDDGTIHLADKASFMRTSAHDYFPQLANTRRDKDIFLNHKQNYGVYINPLEIGREQWSFWLGFSMRDISEIKKRIIILGIVASLSALVVLGVILAFTVKHFTRPIKDLTTGTAVIGRGDLAHRVKITSQDELGQLAHSFNNMAAELEKTTVSKDYVDNIIARMIDALIVVDPEARINSVNKAACEILGYDEKELIGEPVEIIFADDMPLKGEQLERLIKEGELRNYETGCKTKSGKKIPVLFSASVTKDKQGNVIWIVCTARDIADRKRAEEALRESEERYKRLSEVTMEGIVFHDKGILIDVNTPFAEMLGYKAEELIGKNAIDLFALPEYRDIIGQKVAAGYDEPYEVMAQRKDGTILPVELVGREVHYKGKILRVVSVTDISARKKAEEEKEKLHTQLAQAQKVEAIGTLAGGIAHNFNNLLMGIMGNTSLMLLETDPAHPSYERLKNIEKSVQGGSKLTSQLLGYAREGRYEIKPISLNQLVRETSNTFAEAKKEITVHRELAQDLFGIDADQGQIEQVLLNLYVNASDAMPAGGDLFLKTMNVAHKDMKGKPYKVKPGNQVLLTVRDTGVGMDKKTRERIFDPFFTTKGMGRGTGLGLASVYGIVKAHGGHTDVGSKKGHGTTLSIYLPASENKVVEEREIPAEIFRGKGTILLVDDEDMVLDVGEEMLETLGYKVLLARSGKEAIRLYKASKKKIDMVVLDMIMPDMGGGETYDRMKEINPDIKVLLSSGYSIEGRATEILERGCDSFIQKPFNMRQLSQKIREILDSK